LLSQFEPAKQKGMGQGYSHGPLKKHFQKKQDTAWEQHYKAQQNKS